MQNIYLKQTVDVQSYLNSVQKNISIIGLQKTQNNNNGILYLKVYNVSNNTFIIKKILLSNVWFNLFSKYMCCKGSSFSVISPKNINKKLSFKFFFSIVSLLKNSFISLAHGWITQLNLIGLGYKVFVYKNFLYFRLGYCRMVSVQIPSEIKFLSKRKDSVKFLSPNKVALGNFISCLKRLRKFNLYKGKGLYELSDFSSIKLKIGKQQQMF